MFKISKRPVLSAICLALLASTACKSSATPIKPSNNEITKDVSLSNFDAIALSGSIDVTYETGNTPSARIVGSDNIVPLVETKVSDNTLTIKYKDGTQIKGSTYVEVYVVAPAVTQYTVNGSGEISIESRLNAPDKEISATINGSGEIWTKNIECKSLDATVNGSGEITLDSFVKAQTLALTVNGSGEIMTKTLEFGNGNINVNGSGEIMTEAAKATSLTTCLTGSGDIECNAINANNVVASLCGSGDIGLTGKTNNATLTTEASGYLTANELIADNVVATVSGSGDIECYATKEINATANGSGEISYSGSPKNVATHGSSHENIHRSND